jgi:AraC-like DNA-binding protein
MTDKFDDKFTPDIGYVVFRKCTSSWHMYEHIFTGNDITYIIKGKALYTINGVDHELSAGDLLYLPPGTLRKATTFPDQLMHCFSINFKLKTLRGGETKLPLPVLSHIGCRNDLISHFHELCYTWLDRQPGYIMKASGIFLLILHRILELTLYDYDSSAGDYRVKKITRYITKHFTEKITVKKMAEMVGLETSYLGVLFKRETGDSLNQYLMKTRIRNAENILRSGEHSKIEIGKVAVQCGYEDIYYFSKQFKAMMGIPPSKYIPKRDD